jgi:hypothetical protein
MLTIFFPFCLRQLGILPLFGVAGCFYLFVDPVLRSALFCCFARFCLILLFCCLGFPVLPCAQLFYSSHLPAICSGWSYSLSCFLLFFRSCLIILCFLLFDSSFLWGASLFFAFWLLLAGGVVFLPLF